MFFTNKLEIILIKQECLIEVELFIIIKTFDKTDNYLEVV
jgi:hypothetical protein